MAPHTNYRRRVRPQRGPTSVTWLGMLALLIVAGGTALAVMKMAEKERQVVEATEEPSGPRPFEGLAEEAAPELSRDDVVDTSKPFADARAAEEIRDPVWLDAVALAEAADPYYDAAVEAKAAGRVSTMNEKGRTARFKLNQALEATAKWEAELIERYGETDPAVREVIRTRSHWFDRLQWLSKSIAR